MKNKASVVIVTYNSATTIRNCLDSIISLNPGVEIVVVDNNSKDDTLKILQGYKDKVTLIESPENLGFSGANNLGVNQSSGQYLVFLNPDTKLLTKNGLNYIIETLEKNNSFGLIGPRLLYADLNSRKTVRNLPTVSRAFNEYILGKVGVYDFYEPLSLDLSEVESVVGACMVISREIFDKVRGFDERYFLYFEDIQLCKDVSRLGLKVGFLPSVEIEHIEGVSGQGLKTSELLIKSAKIYHGFWEYFLIQNIIRLGNLKNRIFRK